MKIKELQLFLFQNAVEMLLPETISYICWPKEWVSALRVEKERYKLKKKLETLNTKIYSIFPDILYIQNDPKALAGERAWIVARKRLPLEHLQTVCEMWFSQIDSTVTIHNENRLIDWKTGTVEALLPEIDENSRYTWVPALISHKLCDTPLQMGIEGGYQGELPFYPICFGRTFEAMSQPIKRADRRDYFSYVYRFKLITRGIENKPLLNVSFGIRRFYQRMPKESKRLLRQKRKASVFVSIPNPFTHESKQSFARFQIEAKGMEVQWAKGYEKLLDDLMIRDSINLFDIIKNPRHYIENKEKQVLIIHNENTFSGKTTTVERGMGLPEREALLKSFQSLFSGLKLLPACKEVKTRFNKNLFPLHAPSGVKELCLEIISDSMIEAVEEVLLNKNIVTEKIDEHCFILNSFPKVTLKVIARTPEGIVKDLDVESYNERATEKHVQSIVQKLRTPSLSQPILSLVEIHDYEKRGQEEFDPKQAIREGLARTRRLSQFIHPLEQENGKERIYKGVLDLLADRGFLRENWSKFTSEGTIISLSLHRINKAGKIHNLPVFTKIKGMDIKYKTFGNDEWKPLEETILNIWRNEQAYLPNPTRENEASIHLKQFFVDELLKVLSEESEKVYVILNASLRNRWMHSIGNGKISLSFIPDIDDVLQSFPNLRVIRINQKDDVPQYFTNSNGNLINKEAGLYLDQTGIYYSVGTRPDTMKSVPNGATKFNSPTKQLAQQRALEIIVLGANEEERDEIARMVDYLRRMVVTYDWHVQLPFSMHMTRTIKKYIGTDDTYTLDDDLEDDLIVEIDKQVVFVLDSTNE
ncbi:DUF3962 domain-containing protein [Ectobacillus sp. JY-23]|uniref:pPIWI_RE module domain-containing protein n=1 Tax=Ectobacillus sp. JY-23 TaxID=2933872 RepID=UPI001FF2D596|nr:DUF3962 domain-containing protein [Ectobacillus sp. JY-23]UOY92512.1 DUF3962 domain-containing protein [Ectobacillus sp. JY-23]